VTATGGSPAGTGDEPRLLLSADAGPRYLGQPATVGVALTAVGGEPLPNRPVALATSWGTLQFVEGAAVRRGHAVMVRTDGFGTARASLWPPTTEQLRDDEQAALNAMLSRLDPAAGRPADAADALADLAREYRWEANDPFRRAVDVLFRDLRLGVADTVHAYDFDVAWPVVDAIVTGHAGQELPGGQVAATALLPVEFRDWLGAFLQAYAGLTEVQGAVDGRLTDVTKIGGDAGVLLANAYARVRDFVESERGLVGAHLAPEVARRSLRRFVDTAAPDLPLDTRAQLYPAADATAAAVAASGVEVAGAVTRARIDFRQALSATVAEVDPAGLKERLGAVEGEVSATTTAFDDVRNQAAAASTAVEDVKNQVAAASTAVEDVRNQVSATATGLQQILTQVQANQNQLLTFNNRLDVVNQQLNKIDGNEINVIRDRVNNLRIGGPGVAPPAVDVEALRQEVAALTRRIEELASRLPPPPE
jgi:predicted  nucleic acid-binding Zn-ribbon protein